MDIINWGDLDDLYTFKGYINASKLCLEFDKNFLIWYKQNKSLVHDLQSKFLYDLVFRYNTDFFIHKILIVHVASFCSSKIAFQISEIVNYYFKRKKYPNIFENLLEEEILLKKKIVEKLSDESSMCLMIMKDKSDFYIIKRQKKTLDEAVRKHLKKYPNSQIFKKIDCENAHVLWNIIKNRLQYKIICFRTKFYLNSISEKQFFNEL